MYIEVVVHLTRRASPIRLQTVRRIHSSLPFLTARAQHFPVSYSAQLA